MFSGTPCQCQAIRIILIPQPPAAALYVSKWLDIIQTDRTLTALNGLTSATGDSISLAEICHCDQVQSFEGLKGFVDNNRMNHHV